MTIEFTPNTLTDRQEAAFKEAEAAASKLMASLYHIRNTFYEGGSIPPNGKEVWDHIPRAQDLVHKIQDLIKKAKESALTTEAP